MIRNVTSLNDIEACIQLYLETYDTSFIPVSIEYSRRVLIDHVRKRNFLKVYEEKGRIIAALMAGVMRLQFYDQPVLRVIYYCTNQKGFKSAYLVKIMHESMLSYEGVSMILAESSPLDTNQKLVRILEKYGWERKGHVALWRL
jgi:hypothetical protein